MKTLKILSLIALWVTISFSASVQETTCPTIVNEALTGLSTLCADTARNQACYGHVTLEVDPQPGVSDLVFDRPGDIADVGDILALRLTPMTEEVPEWGVAVLKLQANLPGTLPGQNVTVLLFGDVEITSAETPSPEVEVTVTSAGNINVRSGPGTGYGVAGTLASGTTVIADGRDSSGDWIRVQLPENGIGWVASFLIASEDDLSALAVVDAETVGGAPLRAFYLQSGVGDAPCAEAPESGILIRTPGGATRIELTINEVNITLASTVFLQAQASADMRVCTVEGAAQLAAFDQSQLAPAGTCVRVPMDENLAAAGPPEPPQPYGAGEFDALPVGSLSPEQAIEVAAPLTVAEIATLRTSPRSGTWTATWGPTTIACEDGSGGPIDLSSSNGARSIVFAEDGSGAQLSVPGASMAPVQFMRTGPTTYYGLSTKEGGFSEAIHWMVVDAEHMTGFSVIEVVLNGVPCRIDQAPFTLTFEEE